MNEEYQRIARVKSFFEHPGFQEYEAEIKGFLNFHSAQVERICSSQVKQENLEQLNFHIAQKDCFLRILDIKERMLADVGVESPEEEGVKEPLEVN